MYGSYLELTEVIGQWLKVSGDIEKTYYKQINKEKIMGKYLDEAGVSHLWGKVKSHVGGVKQELDADIEKLNDKVFPLTVSVTGGGLYEKGTSRDVSVGWTVKRGDDLVSAAVTVNGEAVSGEATSKKYTGVTTDTTYTVEATYDGRKASGSTRVRFVAPMYFGFSSAAAVDSLNVKGLVKQGVKDNPKGTVKLTAGATGYLWLCMPDSMSVTKVTLNGFDVPMEAVQNWTDDSLQQAYRCYRSSNELVAKEYTFVINP